MNLIVMFLPLIEQLLAVAAGPVEKWAVDEAVKLIESHLEKTVKLDTSWSFSAAITDETAGIVTVSLYRGGQPGAVLVLYPLQLTDSHQKTIAALFETLVQGAGSKLLALIGQVVAKKAS